MPAAVTISHGSPLAARCAGDPGEDGHRLARHGVALRRVELQRAVALVAGQAQEPQARASRRSAGRPPAPPRARRRRSGACPRPRRRGRRSCSRPRRPPPTARPPGRRRRPPPSRSPRGRGARAPGSSPAPTTSLITNTSSDPRAGHHDGLPDGRAADADRAVLDLEAGDVRALVHLDVGAQRRGDVAHVLGHERRGWPRRTSRSSEQRRRRQLVARPPEVRRRRARARARGPR